MGNRTVHTRTLTSTTVVSFTHFVTQTLNRHRSQPDKSVFQLGVRLAQASSHSGDIWGCISYILWPQRPTGFCFSVTMLHSFYTGIENIFKRVALEIDGDIPSGYASHSDLLTVMTRSTASRPPVIQRNYTFT